MSAVSWSVATPFVNADCPTGLPPTKNWTEPASGWPGNGAAPTWACSVTASLYCTAAGATTTTGADLTVTVNEQVLVLPAASFAVTLTVVTPTGKAEPDAGLLVTVTAETVSPAMTLKLTAAVVAPGAAATTMSAGHETLGAVVSRTVTLNVALTLLPAPSVAVAVTSVVPGAKVLPEGVLKVTASAPSRLSSAVAV